jgi:hypothetical protein
LGVFFLVKKNNKQTNQEGIPMCLRPTVPASLPPALFAFNKHRERKNQKKKKKNLVVFLERRANFQSLHSISLGEAGRPNSTGDHAAHPTTPPNKAKTNKQKQVKFISRQEERFRSACTTRG